MATPKGLSDDDIAILKGLIERDKARVNNTAQRPKYWVDDEEQQAPEVYIAYTPEDGIPAMVGLVPGVAECNIYHLVNNEDNELALETREIVKDVYNFASAALPGDTPIVIERTKGGYWFTSISSLEEITKGHDDGEGNGGSLIGGGCNLAKLRTTDCIQATSSNGQELILPYDAELDRWTGFSVGTGTDILDQLFYYPGGSGILEFWYSNGRLHLSLNDLELLDCGDGCFTGGPLTGHVTEDSTGTGTGFDTRACHGETFTVCINCIECRGVVGTGTGTGTSTSTGTDNDTVTGTSSSSTGPPGELISLCNFCPGGVNLTLTLTIVSGCPAASSPQIMTYNGSGIAGAGWYTPTESLLTDPGHVIVDHFFYLPCHPTPLSPPGFKILQYINGSIVGSGQNLIGATSCTPFDSGSISMTTVSPCSGTTVVRVTGV